MSSGSLATGATTIAEAARRRADASTAFFAPNAERMAQLCRALASRFLAGGRLLAFGVSPPARSDVRHVAVEFVHPVIVGKRALPAIGLTDVRALTLLAEPGDAVMVFADSGDGSGPADAVSLLRARGCLTIAFSELGAEWVLRPPADDPCIRQELVETTYHVLWELVHLFFEHRGSHTEGAGASSFLYPFLTAGVHDEDAVLADVRESVLMKAQEVQELREMTLSGAAPALERAAGMIRAAVSGGGRVLALGNGGSATDAMDFVADLIAAGHPAHDLSEDSAIITAVANDIGPEAMFARQVIAFGRPRDVLVAFSTSGSSLSVVDALEQARTRSMATVAFVGYDGGAVAADQLADVLVLTPSQHIPRIQEAQATAYHVLIGMV